MNKNEYSKTIVFDSTDNSLIQRLIKIPPLKEGEILVKNEYVTLCKSDLNTFTGKRNEKNPTILGHEIVGRIFSFDKNAVMIDGLGSTLSVGDRITWSIYSSDPNSYFSKIGIPQKGENLFKYGHEKLTDKNTLHGGLAQYIILRKNTPIIKLDEKIPLKISAIINCAVATVAGALRIAGEILDKRVLVIGAGMLGVTACAMLKSSCAKFIALADLDPQRLLLSQKFGSDIVFNTLELSADEIEKKTGRFDLIFEFSGAPESMETAMNLLDIGGTTIWVGATFPQRDINLSAEKLIRNIHTIKGLHNYNKDDLISAVKFIEANHDRYPFDNIIEDRFTLEQAADAFNYAINANPLRAGIEIK